MFKLKVEIPKQANASVEEKMMEDLAGFVKDKGTDVGTDIRKMLKLQLCPRNQTDEAGTDGGAGTKKKSHDTNA